MNREGLLKALQDPLGLGLALVALAILAAAFMWYFGHNRSSKREVEAFDTIANALTAHQEAMAEQSRRWGNQFKDWDNLLRGMTARLNLLVAPAITMIASSPQGWDASIEGMQYRPLSFDPTQPDELWRQVWRFTNQSGGHYPWEPHRDFERWSYWQIFCFYMAVVHGYSLPWNDITAAIPKVAEMAAYKDWLEHPQDGDATGLVPRVPQQPHPTD